MVRRIITFAAHNRVLVILLTAAAVIYAFYAMRHIRLDAIPDLSDTQVIVYTKWDRSPDIVEDQVTYPIITALLGTPRVKAIRGYSDFGFSYVYVIFKGGTDIYWARSRVLEYLSKIQGELPQGVTPELGPDATGVGWVYQYVLEDDSHTHSLAELRTYQDWYLRYALQSVPGVAEVASLGGFQKQYQVTVDPARLQAYNISLKDIAEAIRQSNNEVGGRLIEWAGAEFMVRAQGYIKSIHDLGQVVVKANGKGTPVLLKDVADIALGPQIRRGILDWNGLGDAVGGIVVMRHGENALNVIDRVKAKLEDMKPSLPAGVRIVPAYDRSGLIKASIHTLKHELIVEMIIVSLVILFFLWHIPSAIVPIITIPIAVILAFIPMYFLGITSNIMSLSGIAISIGVLVDGAIVEVENAYRKLEIWQEEGRKGDFHAVRLEALLEIGPSVFFSLAVIAVSFLPVFTLVDQEGRLFKPLAYTKTLSIALAAVLAVTLDPAVRMLFARMEPFRLKPRLLGRAMDAIFIGKYYAEERHPISRILFRLYDPPCRWVLRHPKAVIASAFIMVAAAIPLYFHLGSEFMPPLNEGTILYMPTTLPGISITQAADLLEREDRIIKTFPEVVSVFGKAGRADTSTDPAPLSMMETTIALKPESQWEAKTRWYSSWAPGWLKDILRHIWPDHISYDELVNKMDQALRFPGNTNAWTMPIKGRIDMLTTGIRTPIGIKILGSDLDTIQRVGEEIESALRHIKGTRSVFAERTAGGYFVDITPRREALARYGLTLKDLQDVILAALGGETVSRTVEGRERYTINLRYPRDMRANLDQLKRILVSTPDGLQIPLKEVADVSITTGPGMIRDENGMLAGYVYADVTGRDIGSYVDEAKAAVERQVKLPTGYSIIWSGQYENMLRVKERLKVVVPITVMLIFLLLYMNTRSAFKAMVVMLAVPFSAVGAVGLLYILGYNVSIAVWVGIIALMGLDAETGVFMLLFLDISYEEAKRKGRLNNLADLHEAIVHGAVKRIRPKMMTVMAAATGLMPILWATSTGADMMKRVAAPMVGGLFTSFTMELLVYPAIYLLWRRRELARV
ncbi:MAG: efflux RND transporter permease subunit [Desulfobacteraceae bacterium]|nr:efflux RND transporter permease subunit [Desulfobacteraceae bacterium]